MLHMYMQESWSTCMSSPVSLKILNLLKLPMLHGYRQELVHLHELLESWLGATTPRGAPDALPTHLEKLLDAEYEHVTPEGTTMSKEQLLAWWREGRWVQCCWAGSWTWRVRDDGRGGTWIARSGEELLIAG